MQIISARLLRRGLALGAVTVLAAAGPSFANKPVTNPPGTQTSGNNDNGDLQATVGYTITYPTGNPGPSGKHLGSVNVNWTPPPCWFGPKYTPQQFKDEYTKNFDKEIPDVTGTARTAMGMDLDHYSKGLDYPDDKGYTDFNSAEAGKGMWWVVSVNPDAPLFDQMSCNDQRPEWVPNGDNPPPGTGHVITPDMLSKLAFAHTQVPGVTIKTSPTATQTVNLPTWVWLTERYTPVKVRASVNLGGGREIWAETEAKATSVQIQPGTSDADVFPSSGNCPISANGAVGTAYPGNTKADPPCGVTYLHSTANSGPYQLNVTANWHVTWTGSGNTGGDLGNGVSDNHQDVTVQEIQSVNR